MNLSLSNLSIRSRHWSSIVFAVTSSLLIAACATQVPPQVTASSSPATEVTDGDLKLVLDFKNVPDIPGSLMIAVYNTPDAFRKDPIKSLKILSTPGEMQVEVPGLIAGEYAVMVFHDQNDDGKLNRNLLGIPKEHWSGSLNTSFVLGPPTWDQTRFSLQKTGKSVQINF